MYNSGFKNSQQKKLAIYALLDEIFTDRPWFINSLSLVCDADYRAQSIDLSCDWYYLDDWADKFFTEQYGKALYQQHLGKRILLVNPHGDGSDVLHWLDYVAVK